MDLEIRKFSDINLDDDFFDSLKASYPEFSEWFDKKSKSGASAYVFMDEAGKVMDFLYMKNESEEMLDVIPSQPAKKRLKVGTFKLLPRHTLRGERFMKKIMDRAIADDVEEIYVTIFPTEELRYLIQLFENYGFVHVADKPHSGGSSEYVLIKDMRTTLGDVVKDYPFVRRSGVTKNILSIRPDYHTKLFPDSILRTEDPYDLVRDISSTNSIHKIYICWMNDVEKLKKGDLLLVYRTSDKQGPAYFRSVVTSVCTVNEVKTYKDFVDVEDFVKYTNKYSVFSEGELRTWYKHKNNFTVIKVLYNVAFTKKVTRKSLLDDLGMDANAYWGFMSVTNEQFDEIVKLGKADGRYFID